MDISETARAKARDFIDNEKQFQLGFLPTEQSNPITATLEEDFRRSTLAGVQCLQRGDRQIPITMRHVFAGRRFAKLVDSIVETVTGPKGRVVFSGCGATGRLSILLESMWRDFFHRRAAELSTEERTLADRVVSMHQLDIPDERAALPVPVVLERTTSEPRQMLHTRGHLKTEAQLWQYCA